MDIVEEEEIKDPPPNPSRKGRGVDSKLNAKNTEKVIWIDLQIQKR